MAHSEGHGFDELLAARGTFEVVVEVQDNEAGNGFVAHAKAVGYENDEVVARAEAPDAASAFKGAASAMDRSSPGESWRRGFGS